MSEFFFFTRVGVGVTVQESGVRNGNFLHFAAPLTVGNAARFRARVAWSDVVWTKLRKEIDL